jgi:hypothetical protein
MTRNVRARVAHPPLKIPPPPHAATVSGIIRPCHGVAVRGRSPDTALAVPASRSDAKRHAAAAEPPQRPGSRADPATHHADLHTHPTCTAAAGDVQPSTAIADSCSPGRHQGTERKNKEEKEDGRGTLAWRGSLISDRPLGSPLAIDSAAHDSTTFLWRKVCNPATFYFWNTIGYAHNFDI